MRNKLILLMCLSAAFLLISCSNDNGTASNTGASTLQATYRGTARDPGRGVTTRLTLTVYEEIRNGDVHSLKATMASDASCICGVSPMTGSFDRRTGTGLLQGHDGEQATITFAFASSAPYAALRSGGGDMKVESATGKPSFIPQVFSLVRQAAPSDYEDEDW